MMPLAGSDLVSMPGDEEVRDARARRLQRLAMKSDEIDGRALKKLVNAGLLWLEANREIVNALNVFPVPDGDTGTNMLLTMQSAYKEIADQDEPAVSKVAGAVAQGALMGARGNSGVILSQLWRGFARGLEGRRTYRPENVVYALTLAQETAYRGVVRPVEGTILTVARETASAARKAVAEGADVWEILEAMVAGAAESVARTPELLPVLKQAGVVDSGGKGLFFILEGMLRYVNGLPLDTPLIGIQPLAALSFDASESIEPGQDWEVVVDFRPAGQLDIKEFYNSLETMGTSIQVGEGDGIYRMHIHVPDKTEYQPIEYIKSLGTVSNVRLENLMAQMAELQAVRGPLGPQLQTVEPGQIAVVAVVPGPGLARVFASVGAAGIVAGGQTMNPSTKEILSSFENLPTDQVIILPNNDKIFLACQAAAELTVKQVRVVPASTVPQGIAAMIYYANNREGELDEVVVGMAHALLEVETGEVTSATRTVEIDGVQAQAGQIIGLHNGRLVAGSESLREVIDALLAAMGAAEREIVTLYYGEGVTAAGANGVADRVRAAYANLEKVDVIEGGQPHYFYILSAE